MKIKEIAFVAYAVKDLKRARNFYEDILELKPTSIWEGKNSGFIEYSIGSHTLAIGKGAPYFTPGRTGAAAALEVDNFTKTIAKLKKHGVKFLLEPYESSLCFMALIADTEGNQIAIHKRKKKERVLHV